VKPNHASVHGTSAKVGIIDVSVDGARFRPYRRGLTNPFPWNLSAVAVNHRLVMAVQAHNAAVGTIALRWPPHRSNDGVAPATRHRIGNPLPDRAISLPRCAPDEGCTCAWLLL
jgi:hypothetical protein